MALMQFNGKKATLLFLNGEIIESWDSLKVSYTINDPNELHEFNSDFIYTMEKIDNGDGTYTVNIYSRNDFTSFKCNINTITIDYLAITSNVTSMNAMFSNCTSLTHIDTEGWDTSSVTDMYCMFNNCSSLTSLDVSSFNTSKVTRLSAMFQQCSSLTSLDVSNFDTNSVTDMSFIFNLCELLSSLELFKYNFASTSTLPVDIDMKSMFQSCSSLTSLDVSDWTWQSSGYCSANLEGIFSNCSSLTSITLFDCASYNAKNMFHRCSSLTSLDLSNFDTSGINNMSSMFQYCSSLTSLDISNWDTSSVKNMSSMFDGCRLLTSLDLSNFNTNIVTDMSYMFNNCSGLTSLDLSKFNTNKIVTSDNKALDMFRNVPSNVDWNYDGTNYTAFSILESDTTYSGTFPWSITYTLTINFVDANGNAIQDPYVKEYRALAPYDVSYNVNNVDGYEMTSINGSTSGVMNSDVTITATYKSVPVYIEYTINPYSTSDKIDALSASNTSASWATSYRRYMPIKHNASGTEIKTFNVLIKKTDGTSVTISYNSSSSPSSSILASEVSSIVVEYDVNAGEHFSFEGHGTATNTTHRITGFIVPPKITSVVSDIQDSFNSCTLLTSLDVSSWDVSNVTNMSYAFQDCSKLTTLTGIDLWNTNSLTRTYSMFDGCKSLKTLDLSNWDTTNVSYYDDGYGYITNNADYMFSDVLASCNIYIGANWNPALTESVTDFSGEFKTK